MNRFSAPSVHPCMRVVGLPIFAFALLSSACASSPPPPPPTPIAVPPETAPVVAAPADPPKSPPSCFPKATASHALGTFAHVGGRWLLCIGEEGPVCLSFDGKTWGREPMPGPKEEATQESNEPPFTLATEGQSVKVCAKGGASCKSVKPGFKPRAADYEGAVSDDGKSLFLYRYVAKGKSAIVAQHQLFGEVFEVATGKKTKSFALPVGTADKPGMFADQSDNWGARFQGRHVLLLAYRCCGPAGMQAFVEEKTNKLQSIGDPALFVQLDADTFLVGNEERVYGKDYAPDVDKSTLALEVIDAKTWTRTRLALPGKPRDEPETAVLAARKDDDGSYAIAYANPPGIVRFDPKTKTLGTPNAAPICP